MRSAIPYPPIERHGVIGDRRTAALVASDGTLDWLCLPDYDDDPVFAALIDAGHGGAWRMGPAFSAFGQQRYMEDTAILTTTWRCDEGVLELTDAMPWPDDARAPPDERRRVVLRRLRCTDGSVDCVVDFAPRNTLAPNFRFERADGGLIARFFERPRLRTLGVWLTHPLAASADATRARSRFALSQGQTAWVVLSAEEEPRLWSAPIADEALRRTIHFWRELVARFHWSGGRASTVRRSLITAHLLAYAPSGAMVAAPTLGLPERIAGGRNYDYRFAWIRDASISVAGLSLLGDTNAADRYLRWLSGLGSRTDSPLQVVYDVRGGTKIPQRRLRRAEGYRGSQPVVVGNRACLQRQLGSLGYLADCMKIAHDRGGQWRPEYSSLLRRIAAYTCREWGEKDSGIWELERHQQFVASKVMCWVVLDRAIQIAERVRGFEPADIHSWQAVASEIRGAVLSRGYSEGRGAFRQRYDVDSLDASALLIPLMGFLPPADPRVLSTLDRVEEDLGFRGLVHRFQPDESEGEMPLPLGQFEGAFLPCTFWMVSARAMAGQIDRAETLLERAERYSGELGLFPEEIDARTGEFLGNYPLLFSHVEHLRAVVRIEQCKRAPAMVRKREPQ